MARKERRNSLVGVLIFNASPNNHQIKDLTFWDFNEIIAIAFIQVNSTVAPLQWLRHETFIINICKQLRIYYWPWAMKRPNLTKLKRATVTVAWNLIFKAGLAIRRQEMAQNTSPAISHTSWLVSLMTNMMGTIGKTIQAGYNRFSFCFLAGIKGRIKGWIKRWEQLNRQQPFKHKPENPGATDF